MTAITDTQRRVLELVHAFHNRYGFMPTRAEVARDMGWKSANAAEEALQALRRRGMITTQAGTARSIQLTPTALQLLAGPSPLPTARQDLIALPVVDMARVNRRPC